MAVVPRHSAPIANDLHQPATACGGLRLTSRPGDRRWVYLDRPDQLPGAPSLCFRSEQAAREWLSANVLLPTIKLVIKDMLVLCFDGKWWVSMPGKLSFNPDGTPLLKDNGKLLYTNILYFDTRTHHAAFQQQVLEHLRTEHPELFTEGAR
jgi:hypothetical protein